MNKKLYSILLVVLLSSCYSYSPDSYQEQQNNSKLISPYKETDHSFFWGLQEGKLPLKCSNNKSAKIESANGFMNYFARIYTLGIYWPRTLKIECSK